MHKTGKNMTVGQQKRKVVRHGPGTLTISLPTEWIKRHRISPGDELYVEPVERGLLLMFDEAPSFTKTRISLESIKDKFAPRLLATVYKKGFDRIEVTYDSPESLVAIRKELANNIIGWSIFNETDKSCTVRSIAIESKEDFDAMFRKAFQTCHQIAKVMPQVILAPNEDVISDIRLIERNNNQIVSFCHRLLTKYQLRPLESPFLYVTLWQIEKIADDYKDLLEIVPKLPDAVRKQYAPIYEKLAQLVELYQQAWYDRLPLITVLETSAELLKELDKFKLTQAGLPLHLSAVRIAQRIKEVAPQIIAIYSQSISDPA